MNSLGKNDLINICNLSQQNLYNTLYEDLDNSYIFFKNIYIKALNYTSEKDLNIFISNVLTFMGDLKKLKLMLNKKFADFFV